MSWSHKAIRCRFTYFKNVLQISMGLKSDDLVGQSRYSKVGASVFIKFAKLFEHECCHVGK